MTGRYNELMPRPLGNALGLFILATMIGACYGFQYTTFAQRNVGYYAGFSVAFALVLSVLTHSVLVTRVDAIRLSAVHGWLGFMLMTFSFTLTLFFQSKFVAPIAWYALAAATGTLGFLAHRTWGARGSTLLFALAGLALVIVLVARTGVWEQGDMLLVVEAASRELLAGKQPYRAYPEIYHFVAEMEGVKAADTVAYAEKYSNSRIPLVYLPGTWLAYLPSVALGLDPRILNIVLLVLVVLVFERWVPIRGDRPLVLSLTLYPILLSPSFLGIFKALHGLHFWLLLLGTVLGIAGRRYWTSAIFFGLALATRQESLFLVAPLFAYLVLRMRWKRLFRYALASLGVYLLLTVPFAIAWGQDFMFWKHMYLTSWWASDQVTPMHRQIGLTNILDVLGMHKGFLLLQIVTLLGSAALLLVHKQRSFSWALQFFGLTFIWLVAFNVYAVRYIYYPGFILFLVGAAMTLGNPVFTQRLAMPGKASAGNPETPPERTGEKTQ